MAATDLFAEQALFGGYFQPDMITGPIPERPDNQILFAVNPTCKGSNILTDTEYRNLWLDPDTQALLFGLAGPRPQDPAVVHHTHPSRKTIVPFRIAPFS